MSSADTAVTLNSPRSDTDALPKGKCCRGLRDSTNTPARTPHTATLAQVEQQSAPASGCQAVCTQVPATADSALKESREEQL